MRGESLVGVGVLVPDGVEEGMGHGFLDSNPLVGVEGKQSVEQVVEFFVVAFTEIIIGIYILAISAKVCFSMSLGSLSS